MRTAHRFVIVLAAALAAALALVPSAARAQEPPPPSPPAKAPSLRILSLAEVERSALQLQPQLLVARANTNVALAQADQAFAPLLPQVAGVASYTRETGNPVVRPGISSASAGTPVTGTSTTSAGIGTGGNGSIFSNSYDYWQFGVNASQLIYDFGQTYEKYKSAKLNAESQRLTEQTTRLDILLNVRKAYFNARASKELVDVAKETLDDQNKHLVQVQGMVQVGTQPPIALAQQKASVANAVVQLITAQNNYETSKAQLNQAAGLAQGTEYDVSDEDTGPIADEDQPLEALVAKAIAARPEIATLVRQREAQQATLASAKGTYGPSIGATAGISEIGENLEGLTPNWNVGVGATWYLFQGGLTKGLVRQAEAQIDSVDAQKSLEELQVRLDVDSARLAVRAAKATIGAVDDALTSAREQLRLAEQRYSTGVGNIIELTDAQVAYTTAAAQVVQARYGLASARAQLLAALGRT